MARQGAQLRAIAMIRWAGPSDSEHVEPRLGVIPGDAPIVVHGEMLGGLSAFIVGVITGDDLLTRTAIEGLSETREQNKELLVFFGTMGRGKSGAAMGIRPITIGTKVQGQLSTRGWSRSSIDDAISNPIRTVTTRDTRHLPGGERMNDPATAYYSRTGGYVVRNDRTGDIVQVSKRNDPNWRAPWD